MLAEWVEFLHVRVLMQPSLLSQGRYINDYVNRLKRDFAFYLDTQGTQKSDKYKKVSMSLKIYFQACSSNYEIGDKSVVIHHIWHLSLVGQEQAIVAALIIKSLLKFLGLFK